MHVYLQLSVRKISVTLKTQKLKIVKTAKSMDPAEVAHIESPPLDLTCVPSVLSILNMNS